MSTLVGTLRPQAVFKEYSRPRHHVDFCRPRDPRQQLAQSGPIAENLLNSMKVRHVRSLIAGVCVAVASLNSVSCPEIGAMLLDFFPAGLFPLFKLFRLLSFLAPPPQ